MKRIYHPYTEWEDFKNGMYAYSESPLDKVLIQNAIKLLSDPLEFENAAMEVVSVWIKCAENNMTNTSCNRRAWLGQAACCFKYRVPELLTRQAWGRMGVEKRNEANNIAAKIIKYYEGKNKKLHIGLGVEML